MFQQSDTELASNAPFTLFTLPNGSRVTARALTIDQADEWLEKAQRAAALEGAMTRAAKAATEFTGSEDELEEQQSKVRELSRKARAAVAECVLGYPNVEGVEVVASQVAAGQIARAFIILQMVNDPLAQSTILQTDMMRDLVKGLPTNGVTRK